MCVCVREMETESEAENAEREGGRKRDTDRARHLESVMEGERKGQRERESLAAALAAFPARSACERRRGVKTGPALLPTLARLAPAAGAAAARGAACSRSNKHRHGAGCR